MQLLIAAALSQASGMKWIGRDDHEHDAFEHEHSHVHDLHHRQRHDGPVTEPHSQWHRYEPLRRRHPHSADLHHRHRHG